MNIKSLILALGLTIASASVYAAPTVSVDQNPDPLAEYYDFSSPGVTTSFSDTINLSVIPTRDLVAVIGGTGTGVVNFSLFNLYAASDLSTALAVGDIFSNGANLSLGNLESAALGGNYVIKIEGTATGFAGYNGNITLTAPVPEADAYAMMLAGLGLIGFVARRRLAA